MLPYIETNILVLHRIVTRHFEVRYSAKAKELLKQVEENAKRKMLQNIEKSSYKLDPRLFKKISYDLWEFRTRFNKTQYRLLAFWDRREANNTRVTITNGFVKKTRKVPISEIETARKIRKSYLKQL